MADKVIRMKYCTVHYRPNEEPQSRLFTRFPNGFHYGAYPHDTPHYHVIAHRCGYGDDLWQYAFEHEFSHSFVCEWLTNMPSHVILCLAYGGEPNHFRALQEEILAQTFQRWLRANERPILGGVDWDAMKAAAIEYLG